MFQVLLYFSRSCHFCRKIVDGCDECQQYCSVFLLSVTLYFPNAFFVSCLFFLLFFFTTTAHDQCLHCVQSSFPGEILFCFLCSRGFCFRFIVRYHWMTCTTVSCLQMFFTIQRDKVYFLQKMNNSCVPQVESDRKPFEVCPTSSQIHIWPLVQQNPTQQRRMRCSFLTGNKPVVCALVNSSLCWVS